jgi:O-methyltransferase involved in polyketide biosynthesis
MNDHEPQEKGAGMTRIPEGVGWTALLTAYGRAQDSREAAKLFDDPLAPLFLAAIADAGVSNGGKLPRLGPAVDDGSSALWNAFRFYFCARTPFYDQRVLSWTSSRRYWTSMRWSRRVAGAM